MMTLSALPFKMRILLFTGIALSLIGLVTVLSVFYPPLPGLILKTVLHILKTMWMILYAGIAVGGR